ncbi:MAG: AMP-binding protein [Cytophagales bacterium]|nr:AMP-binding protein [Cytophagales bacterium]
MIRVHAGGKWITLEEIGSGIAQPHVNNQEAKALLLIKQWIEGVSEFTFHTSGTTGPPRPLTFTRGQLETSARITAGALSLQPGYTSLVCLDVQFVAGAMMIVRSLISGMDMIIRAPSGNPFLGIHAPVDFAALVPAQLISMLDQGPEYLRTLKAVLIGGAPLPAGMAHRLQPFEGSFFATYGMTETLTHIALQKLNGTDRQDAFHVLPDFVVTLDDRGCLVVSAPHLGPEPVVTNDYAEMITETSFRILGRTDDIINSGGIKIQPQLVEELLQKILDRRKIYARFMVAGLPDDVLGERLVLIMEGDPLPPEHHSSLLSAMAEELPKYKAPKTISYIPRFTCTATQKIDRNATLRELQEK